MCYCSLLIVPATIRGMEFEFGPGVVMGPEIFQTLGNVWHHRDCPFSLYVCIICPSQVGDGSYFMSAN